VPQTFRSHHNGNQSLLHVPNKQVIKPLLSSWSWLVWREIPVSGSINCMCSASRGEVWGQFYVLQTFKACHDNNNNLCFMSQTSQWEPLYHYIGIGCHDKSLVREREPIVYAPVLMFLFCSRIVFLGTCVEMSTSAYAALGFYLSYTQRHGPDRPCEWCKVLSVGQWRDNCCSGVVSLKSMRRHGDIDAVQHAHCRHV
jgi:hypothetical protein